MRVSIGQMQVQYVYPRFILFAYVFQQNWQNEYTPDHTQTEFTFIAATYKQHDHFVCCIISSRIYAISSCHLVPCAL